MAHSTETKPSFMVKLATVIVDRRNLFFLITIIGLIFSAFSRNWVEVENDLTYYLPDDAETKVALNLMEDQFTTYGTADVMVANITYRDAEHLADSLKEIKGVQSVDFDETTDHYNNASALFSITFDADENDDQCLTSLDSVKDALSGYDLYVSTDLGNTLQETIDQEVSVIMVYVAIIVVIVLTLTSQTFGEIPVLILTFVTAMVLNQGSNFLLGKISFVSKLSKAIPEISASSLTTIGGLAAMLFMQFKVGPDMGICLIKAIVYALLSVFVVMPGLLVLFGPLIEKTKHRNFVPKISLVGKLDYATRFVVPAVFLVVIGFAFYFSNQCPYAYGYSTLTTPKLNESQIADQMISDNFGTTNMLALVIPAGDYEKEAKLLDALEDYNEIDSAMGLSNIEAMDGYMLADQLTPRQFAELADLDYEVAQGIYAAYAAKQEDYVKLAGNISTYRVPLIDMFLYVCDQVDSGLVTLDQEQMDLLSDAETQMKAAKAQLCGSEYDRLLLYLNLPVSGDTTYAFTDTIRELAQEYYPDQNVYVAGDSTNEYDFQKSFARDNMVVSIVSILIVLVVLLFTFKSAGMPILLILVIQGSIWINFSIPTFTGTGLFFMSYLVVSSIQMGANIDYAIVIASRYQEMKNTMPHKQAMIETLNFAFPTVITSGSILSVAGTLIGQMTSEAAIVGIGQSLGRGTILSMFLVLFVLPQILLIGGGIVDKTSFAVPSVTTKAEKHGKVYVNGMVRGEIHGSVHGMMRANVDGDVDLRLLSGGFSADDQEYSNSSDHTTLETPDSPQQTESPSQGKEADSVEV